MKNEFVMVLGMAVVTLLIRYPILAVVGKIRLPDPILSALKYVPPAVLTAIIVPAMLFKTVQISSVIPELLFKNAQIRLVFPVVNFTADQVAFSYRNDFLVSGVICAIVAWRSRNLLLTIVVGMVTLIAWRSVLNLL